MLRYDARKLSKQARSTYDERRKSAAYRKLIIRGVTYLVPVSLFDLLFFNGMPLFGVAALATGVLIIETVLNYNRIILSLAKRGLISYDYASLGEDEDVENEDEETAAKWR